MLNIEIKTLLDAARIDCFLLGIKEESHPKLIIDDDCAPEDTNSVWLRRGQFGEFSKGNDWWNFNEQKKLVILANSHQQALNWIRSKGCDLCGNIKYLHDPASLRGSATSYLVRIGDPTAYTDSLLNTINNYIKWDSCIELDARDDMQIVRDLRRLVNGHNR